MATFLARGGSAPVSLSPFWGGDSERKSDKENTISTIRPAGVPGAYDERSANAKKERKVTMADTVAALYESSKSGRKHIVPGYTGYIAHSGEIAGRSQSRVAARAAAHTPDELALKDALPSDPVHKESLLRLEKAYSEKLLHKDMASTIVGRNETLPRHISGYTGHIPGIKDCSLGLSYGAITADTLKGSAMNAKQDRRALIEAGSTFDVRGTTPGYPYLRPRPKPDLRCDDPSLYLHYTGK